ncbi:MAG: ATP-binding protein [Bacteroidales bacterium]|jgi:NadR type nicotinamide-nucleotide adenylyltransferase|nr:ATP-binding protein [Bacteroidales bacterium]
MIRKKIVLIGAESTGKTELAKFLAEYFNTSWVPEYAREYIENLMHRYTYDDVIYIARKQVELEKEYLKKTNSILFYDTFLIITKVWLEVVYGKCPDWIIDNINESKIDLFLLCNNDIPWINDSVRENGGEMRDKLFNIYRKELEYFNFNFEIISGIDNERKHNAIRIIENKFYNYNKRK